MLASPSALRHEGLRPVSGVVCKLTRDFWQSDMMETGNSWLDSLQSFIEGCSCAQGAGSVPARETLTKGGSARELLNRNSGSSRNLTRKVCTLQFSVP